MSENVSQRDLLTYPTWERYTILSKCITGLNIKDRRTIFQAARSQNISEDVFFPHHGITFSEFAVWYTLGDSRRTAKKNR